jgi:DNA-directed RNA polymerase subunit RPC12/RpoP
LDQSGFIRRLCSSCGRQFKWFGGTTEDRPDDFLEPENYTCPYCGVTASPDDWLTSEQLEYAQAVAMGPLSRQLEHELTDGLGQGWTFTPEIHDVPDLLVDPDDMVIVEPPCHPFEPLKVLDDWSEPLHCLMCGSRFRI